MASKFSKSFYNSAKWKKASEAYRQLKFGICERCGQSNAKQVHHKIYLTPYNVNEASITLDFANFELLCDICHQKEHFEKYSPCCYGLEFNSDGEIIKK